MNISLGRKIGGGFGVVIGIAIILGAVSLRAMWQAERSAAEIAGQFMPVAGGGAELHGILTEAMLCLDLLPDRRRPGTRNGPAAADGEIGRAHV